MSNPSPHDPSQEIHPCFLMAQCAAEGLTEPVLKCATSAGPFALIQLPLPPLTAYLLVLAPGTPSLLSSLTTESLTPPRTQTRYV